MNDLQTQLAELAMQNPDKSSGSKGPHQRRLVAEADRIADVTYGAGAFWNKVDLTKYDFMPSDLRHDENKYDFCHLPYPDEFVDVVVFDPPYVQKHSVSEDLSSYSTRINKRYGLSIGTESYADIVQNFEDGMAEGKRVLRRGGLLLVKCANFFKSTQRWLNEDVFRIANQLGLSKVDEFVLLRQCDPVSVG